ncbi:MAG TPA: dihydroorotase [Thermoleophilaceae bacterium]|jgi:dihydroorotase|nr:dihydroorotase [Thermoleophilaceae bacterium]
MKAAGSRPSSALELDRAGAPAGTVLVRRARLLDPRARLDSISDLLIREGRVAEIGDSLEAPEGAEQVDAYGLHAFPAFVDPHVHLRTPGREDEEDIDSGTRAAAAGGFCAIIAQPNTEPVVDSAPVLRSLRERARGEARIPTGIMAAITVGQRGEGLTEMAELADAGAAGFTDDGLPVRSAGMLRQALQYQHLAGRVIALHEEDPSLSAGGAMHEGEVSALLGVAGIPSISESTMIARDCALALYERGRIHVQHVSARESVEAIERARQSRAEVTCEATPHHLLLTDEDVRSLDTNMKMNPPLRAPADRNALIDALRSGTIDCVATDHAPHAREEKEQPFELAPMGVTGLETAFAALHTGLVLPGLIGLDVLVERMTAGGEPFGLEPPGLAPGSRANLCLVDLDAEWEVGEAGYESRSENCAFAGRRLTGRVRMTVADGSVAYRERSFALGAVT